VTIQVKANKHYLSVTMFVFQYFATIFFLVLSTSVVGSESVQTAKLKEVALFVGFNNRILPLRL